jgi:hypothetical protein
MFKRAKITAILETEGGSLTLSVVTGAIPHDKIGAKIGEAVDRELGKLLHIPSQPVAAPPKKRGRPKKVDHGNL